MSTSDSQGKEPLTRKQLREIRLTGATPVITEEDKAPPAPVLPRAAEPTPVAPAPIADDAVDLGAAPLTRRQAREQDRIRTASVPVIGMPEADAEEQPAAEDVSDEKPAESPSAAESESVDAADREDEPEIVSGVPVFAPVSAAASPEAADESADDNADEPGDDTDDATTTVADEDAAAADDSGETPDEDAEADLVALGVDPEAIEDEDSEEDDSDDDEPEQGERPTVNPTFGQGVLADEQATKPFTPSFDELITVSDSTGSQHVAPSALIFNPPLGEGSLSGPVASTGEVLITGTYELPEGLGSRGHAKGVADGKEVDAVLIDGELPPASSPTPIAASSAISTIKPAGEVIRPPAPEKGNKLMLTLAITAGGLALALAAALIIAFTMNVL